MVVPSKIKIIKPNRFTSCWYDNRIGQIFTVIGINNFTKYYEVDLTELYENGELTVKLGFVPQTDAEIVDPKRKGQSRDLLIIDDIE